MRVGNIQVEARAFNVGFEAAEQPALMPLYLVVLSVSGPCTLASRSVCESKSERVGRGWVDGLLKDVGEAT